MDELKPCPFCKYKVRNNDIKDCIERMASYQDRICYLIRCYNCGLQTKPKLTKEDLIIYWNDRL